MQYHRSPEDIRRFLRAGPFVARFTDAELLSAIGRTEPDYAAAVLPRPLRPTSDPRFMAFVAHYPTTNFGISYREGALFVSAEYHGESGWYCLSMPVTDDTAMVLGREIHGFPKKMADDISLTHDATAGRHVVGYVIRHGEEILRIEGDYELPVAPHELPMGGRRATDLDGRFAFAGTSFLFKHVPATSGSGFAHLPQLVRQVTLFTPHPGQMLGTGKVLLRSSGVDDLGSLPVRDVVHTWHGRFDIAMVSSRVARRVRNPLAFAPYSMFSSDVYSLIDPASLPQLSWGERWAKRRELGRY